MNTVLFKTTVEITQLEVFMTFSIAVSILAAYLLVSHFKWCRSLRS